MKGKDKSARPEKFDGYCGKCGKWGHKQKDCWSTVAAVENAGAAPAGEPVDTGAPKALKALTAFDDDEGVDGWLLALETPTSSSTKSVVRILADSGSSETCCAPHHFPGSPV